MAVILGINAHHPDAAACLLIDGKLIAAVAEERLGKRLKHNSGFPLNAILSVLKSGCVEIQDVDHVAIGNSKNANLGAKVGHVLANPVKSLKAVALHAQRRKTAHGVRNVIAETCGVGLDKCRFEINMVEHHLAHIASSFLSSPFDQAAGFSYDGSGDFVSAMFAKCTGTKIEILKKVFVPDSLGSFYTAICQFMGFDRFGEEYKVMGLAAYGEPGVYDDLMSELVAITDGGGFKLDAKYFAPIQKSFAECLTDQGEIILPPLYTDELIKKLGRPRLRTAELSQRDMNLARACQDRFEHIVVNSINELHRSTMTDALVTAGGCALNGVCNARILRDTPFQRSYIQCAASDDGTAVGAALYVWNCVLGNPRAEPIDHAYWGPEYSERELECALQGAGLKYQRLDDNQLYDHVATHMLNGHVVGWYQGRSEWGPRALGNRSIIAHPGWPGMKDLINLKIKRRESFRPFAPSILADQVSNYFEQTIESPFMMHVVRIKSEMRGNLAAICHKDFTGRLHTVKRSQNQKYYDVIERFWRLGGVPVVLNTSFNENEPIVDRPEQAIACFVRTDIDVLALGPFVITKPGKELPATPEGLPSDSATSI